MKNIVLLLLGLLWSISNTALAVNYYTQAGGAGAWGNASHWVGGVVPGNNAGTSKWSAPNDTIFVDHPLITPSNFTLAGSNLIVIIRTGGSLSINTSPARNITLNRATLIVDGGTLNVGNNFTTSNPSPITISNNGTVNVSGNMSINNTVLTIEDGSTLNVTGSFSTSNTAGSVLNIDGDMNVGAGMTQIAGTWNIGSTGTLDVTGNLTNDTGGTTFNIAGDVTVSGNTSFHSGNFNVGSGGTYTSNGAGTVTFGSANITNDGVMNFPNATASNKWGGTFDCNGSSGNGTVGFGAGAFCGSVCAGGSGTLCVDNGAPLPIELNYFNVNLTTTEFLFSWETLTEENNDFFTVEYSHNLSDFIPLFEVEGAGNSLSSTSYSSSYPLFTFENILYFRLKQTDFDDSYSYSQIVAVNNRNKLIPSFVSIYPNPTKGKTLIQLAEKNEIPVYAQLLSPVTMSLIDEFVIENGQAVIELGGLENGVYILRINSSSVAPLKVVVQK